MEYTVRPAAVPDDYPRLVEIWRSAVTATHDFLTPEDSAAIESALVPNYFPHVALHVAEKDGRAVGFTGTAETMLEMLFVDASTRGTGVGSVLLDHALSELGVNRVDVNEQNEQAVGFYRHRGFTVVGRSEVDGDGRPYPLLHLAIDP